MAEALAGEFNKYGYPISTTLSKETTSNISLFNILMGTDFKCDNQKSKDVLGIKYAVPPQDYLIQMGKSMAEVGIIENKMK